MIARAILVLMVEGDITRHPIQLLVNYWETRPSLMGGRLDELLRQGITSIATFIPWQAVESDISHALVRFLQAAGERKMRVSLILTPEVGVHYPNSGLPKDLFSKPENTAAHCYGKPISVNLPPNAFLLPSFSAPEFGKRYHNFLSRMDALLADLIRTTPSLAENITTVLSGGFWKYYRSFRGSSARGFGGKAGDFSSCASVAYRQRLEQFFAQKEFADPNPAAANRWKTRQLEDVNQRWFFQHEEDVFRSRSAQFIRRKAVQIPCRHIELFTPEADPGFAYSNFLQLISGGNGDFFRLSSLLEESATRLSAFGDEACAPYVHWTGLGAFRSLSDAEKQFLFLKSLLLHGSRGGGVLIDEAEWFSLSQVFRNRADALARSLLHGELALRNRALYLSPHLWSDSGTLWEELHGKLGASARIVSSVDLVLQEREASLVVVDPCFIFTRESLNKLLSWARGGRVVVLPRGPLYTESARIDLDRFFNRSGGMEITLGISYRLQPIEDGKVVLFDLPDTAPNRDESVSAWQGFIASILSLAGIPVNCASSDSRLRLVGLHQRGGGLGLFIMNGTGRAVAADLIFPAEVSVSDLGASLVASRGGQEPVVPASRFALEVPPCGVLPLSVDGLADAEERREAAITSEVLREHAQRAAENELPGFSMGQDLEATWN